MQIYFCILYGIVLVPQIQKALYPIILPFFLVKAILLSLNKSTLELTIVLDKLAITIFNCSFYCLFWGTKSVNNAQGLLYAIHSVISPGGIGAPSVMLRIKPIKLFAKQTPYSYMIVPDPVLYYFCLLVCLFWAISDCDKILFMFLCLGITPDGARWTIHGPRN